MKKYTAIDLFCGAGGLTLGLKKAGFKVLAGIELDQTAAKTYKMNHGRVKLYCEDIRYLDPRAVLGNLGMVPGELDILAGCPPCQGFSSHKTRNKSSSVFDVRNDLIFEFLKYVECFLPNSIMLENVPALAKDERILLVINRLRSMGYLVDEGSVRIKDASDYGVPQRRKRMILIASKREGMRWAAPDKKRKTVRQAISSLKAPGDSGDFLHDLPVKRSDKVMDIIKSIPKDGGSRSDLDKKFWLKCHLKNPGGYRDVYGRMRWDDVAPTITGGCHNPSKGRFVHPDENRAITLREAALLQTFPKGYKFSLEKGKDAVALMIGNALPPRFIQRHAAEIYNHLESSGEL